MDDDLDNFPRYPIFIEAGLLFARIETPEELARLYADQREIAQCSLEAAIASLNGGLRSHARSKRNFGAGNEYTGETLGEWLDARPE